MKLSQIALPLFLAAGVAHANTVAPVVKSYNGAAEKNVRSSMIMKMSDGSINQIGTASIMIGFAKALDTGHVAPRLVCPVARVLEHDARETAAALTATGKPESIKMASALMEAQKRGEFHVRKNGCEGPKPSPKTGPK